MRLFGGSRENAERGRTRPHSHLALAPEDVEASERCAPQGDLKAYAAARDYRFDGSVITGNFVGVLPNWPDYVFNVCRGPIGGRRLGVIEHELLEIPVDPNRKGSGVMMGGSFWAVREGLPPGWQKRMIPGMTELGLAEPGNEPFASIATWAPTTTVAIHVPEAAMLGRIVVRPTDRMGPIGNIGLEEYGLPRFRMAEPDLVPEATRAAIFGGVAGNALDGVDAPFVELRMHHAQLALKRNGFVEDETKLDEFVDQALVIADAIAGACRSDSMTRTFDEALPPPPPETGRFAGLDRWDDTLNAAAEKFKMTREDPAAYHAAFPRLQFPGTARGVLRGRFPAGGINGRLAFHEHGGRRDGWLRAGALFPAPEGAPPSPPGGVLHEPTKMYVAVADGVVACWSQQMDAGTLAVTPTAEKATATARELGLLPD